jgi:probable phosphomutase (TIGR03848 family)
MRWTRLCDEVPQRDAEQRMTVVHLVRHGITPDTGKRLSGRTPGLHLSSDGRSQAAATAAFLKDVDLKAIYSSPIERCLETAEIVASAHKRKARTLEGLIEVDYGSWSNRTFASLQRLKLWSTVLSRPSAVTFPNGESIRGVQSRAVEAIEILSAKHPKDHICCVTHADVIRLVMAHYLGVHVDLYQRIFVAPASVSVLYIDDEAVRVLALNTDPARVS